MSITLARGRHFSSIRYRIYAQSYFTHVAVVDFNEPFTKMLTTTVVYYCIHNQTFEHSNLTFMSSNMDGTHSRTWLSAQKTNETWKDNTQTKDKVTRPNDAQEWQPKLWTTERNGTTQRLASFLYWTCPKAAEHLMTRRIKDPLNYNCSTSSIFL